MSKKKLRIKIEPKDVRQTQSIRFSEHEKTLIQRAANRYAGGEFSDWVRYASLNFVPSEEDLEPAP